MSPLSPYLVDVHKDAPRIHEFQKNWINIIVTEVIYQYEK